MPGPGWSLAAPLLGFFVVTLDAVIVNVAHPHIRGDLHGSMHGLQVSLLIAAAVSIAAGVSRLIKPST